MTDDRCPHRLCNRDRWERETADAECMLADCPYLTASIVTPAPEDAMTRAINAARGGPAPTPKRGFA